MLIIEDLKPQRILLIEPPFYRLFGYKRWHYPLSMTLIATYMEELGHTARVFDADKPTSDCREYNRSEAGDNYYRYLEAINNPADPIWHSILKAVEDFQPDIVGLTAITAKIDSANLIAKMIREKWGDKIKIMIGGPHVCAIEEDQKQELLSYYDYIAPEIPGIIDRKPNKRLLLDFENYAASDFSSIMTSTGCPNKCTFCCYSSDRRIIYRNIDSIKEEISDLKAAFGTDTTIYIIDDCFLSNKKRFIQISDYIKECGMTYKGGGRVRDITPEVLEHFRATGGQRIYIGVESGSQRILDKIQKNVTLEQVRNCARLLNDSGIPWTVFFIAGFPFETMDDLRQTRDLMFEIEPNFVSLNRFTPYPGTLIYKEYFSDKPIENKDLFQLNRNSVVELDPECHDFIEEMFSDVDKYNSQRKG